MAEQLNFTPREVRGRASTSRTLRLKQRYLQADLMVDVEYIHYLTEAHRQSDGLEALERRAFDHAYAIEHITPSIHPGDRIAGNKTRYIRGAIPYANYAARPFLQQIRKQSTDAQEAHISLGEGGGIAAAKTRASNEDLLVLSGRFLISRSDHDRFEAICEYWSNKSMMAQGDRLWRESFPHADFIDDGWKVGLYTAPHDPCPEGRLVLDFPMALERGYLDLIEDLDARIAAFRPGSIAEGQRLHFWRASKRVLQAGVRFAERYAEAAEALAAAERDPEEAAELLALAEVCRAVPARPARNLREAVQSFWFTYLLGHIEGAHLGFSPGRLDQLLQPYLEADPTADHDQAVTWMEELFVKMTQIEYIASMSWQGLGHGNLYQNCILGGLDRDGQPADNAMSLAILQAQINLQLTQPTLSVWWTEGLSEEFLLKAAECVKTGVGYPAFYNQGVYIEHERRTSGLDEPTIREHAAIGGCTEPVLEGMSYGMVQAGFINHGKLIDLTFNHGVDPVTGVRLFADQPLTTYDEIVTAYTENMHQAIRWWQQYWNYVMLAHRQTVPLIFSSVFVNDCIEKGRCMDDGGARLNNTPTTLSSGLVNVANSLAAVKRLCFDDEVCSVEQLCEALRDNWKGHERLRKKALAAPKWGNDVDEVDDIFLGLFDDYCDWVRGQENYLGQPYDPSMLAISTPVPFGKACGAFPDGRRAGEPLADGVTSAFPGTDKDGPTGVIRSSRKVDHTQIRGGLLNLKFHPTALEAQRGSENLLALIKTYFDSPGFQMQFNVVDSCMLRHAQEHPEQYRDMVVRVAGFSAYWVEMSRDLQNEVISRTEHIM